MPQTKSIDEKQRQTSRVICDPAARRRLSQATRCQRRWAYIVDRMREYVVAQTHLRRRVDLAAWAGRAAVAYCLAGGSGLV